jgi:hypothetical protein
MAKKSCRQSQRLFAYKVADLAVGMVRWRKAHQESGSAADGLWRLADEHDAAWARGKVAVHDQSKVEPANFTTALNLGLRRDQIQDARPTRDADGADPAILRHAVVKRLEYGMDPMPAVLRCGGKQMLGPDLRHNG